MLGSTRMLHIIRIVQILGASKTERFLEHTKTGNVLMTVKIEKLPERVKIHEVPDHSCPPRGRLMQGWESEWSWWW